MSQERCNRLLFFLPGLLLPALFIAFASWTGQKGWWIAFAVYGVLQLLYVAVIEWMRRVGTLSSSETVECGPSTAETSVVLVHGFADTPLAWSRQAEALAQRGWHVIVPELNLAQTDKEWLAAIHAAVSRARTISERVELWGHSMGGALSCIVAQSVAVDRLVLWAPFLEPYMGRFASTILYWCQRLLFLWPHSLTWFPVARHGKGTPETFYRVRRVIPTRTFSAALAVPRQILSVPPSVPTLIILSQHDTVVRNEPVFKRFPEATFLSADNPRSSHALTNAVDWEINLRRVLETSI